MRTDATPTPWLQRIEVSSAKARKVRGGNYVQLATVTPEGLPRCRTVVFRGWLSRAGDDNVRAMKMITDGRSTKVAHVAASPAAELVWWFSKSSEQYRVAGELQLVGGDEVDAELKAARKQVRVCVCVRERRSHPRETPPLEGRCPHEHCRL